MVTAVKEKKLVEKIIEVEEEVITLTLNKTEAMLVKTLMGSVTGTQHSYRKITDQIYDALARQNVITLHNTGNTKYMEASIHFFNEIREDYPL